MVVVPTTYGTTHEDTLYDAGANVIIYANQLMRAKIRAVGEYVDARASQVQQFCPDNLTATVTARNFGYLLRALQEIRASTVDGRLEPGIDAFLADAERLSISAMEDCARRLLNRKEAGAADDVITPVKVLLTVNGVHLSDLGRTIEETQSGSLLGTLTSRLRSRNIPVLRTMTRMFA